MFILLVSQVLNDGSAPIVATKVEDLETAYMRLHQEMASGYANKQNVVSCLAQVMNENGTICKTDYFNRAAEAEPVEP